MSFAKRITQNMLHRLGVDLVPYPPSDWTRARHVLVTVLRRAGINCVLDVGANQGQYSWQLRSFGYKGRIVSFEPVKASFEALGKTAREYPDWKTLQVALASSSGVAEINVSEETVFSSFLAPSESSLARFPGIRVSRTEAVQLRRLDDILPECIAGIDDPRIYLKLDTQGYDLEVIKGSTQSLAKIVALQTEISLRPIYQNMNSYTDSISSLMALGFEIFDFVPVTRDRERFGAIEMDCVMVKGKPISE